MVNDNVDGNYTSKQNQGLSVPPADVAEFLSALHIFLSITATSGNALILIALRNVSCIHPSTKLFFRCLAVTDLCVGLIIQPLYATRIMSHKIGMNADMLYYVHNAYGALGMTLCTVSVATLTAISVDRLLALLLELRYRHVVTLRRVRIVISWFWLIASSIGWLWVWRGDISDKVTSVGSILCLVTSIFCYTKIHLKLRHHQAQVKNSAPSRQRGGEGIPLNIASWH